MEDVNIRAGTRDDLPAIVAIQAASHEASQWDPARYLEQDFSIGCINGRVIGFLVARQVAPGEREILNLAVDPAKRRAGVARRLLARELSAASGAWFLEVRASNAAAIQLYESAGFSYVGLRKAYYHGPAEDAIVMRFFS
jgi:[ribosomal protein S18]-alanine N-acetyltransferase